MSKWINEGGIYYPVGDFKLYPSPGSGIFNLTMNPIPMVGRLGLAKVADSFEFPFKIYDLGINSFMQKVKTTWNNEYFENKKQNLGIVLNGIKGTGKTIAAKLLCNEMELPVIIVSGFIPGMIEFISSLEFECIVLLDEAEKMFNEGNPDASQALLKIIDGAVNKSRKLYILTTNTLSLNDNLLGRPGRIRYIKQFKNISAECIDAYLVDNLMDTSKRKDILEVIDSLEVSTIDTLKAITDEVNIHGALTDMSEFNLSFRTTYTNGIGVFINAEDLGDEKEEKKFEELRAFVDKYKKGNNLYEWWYSELDPKIDPEFVKSWTKEENDVYEEEEYEKIDLASTKKLAISSDSKKSSTSSVRKPDISDYVDELYGASILDINYQGTKLYEGLRTNYGVLVKNLGGNWWIVNYNGRGEYRVYIEKSRRTPGYYRGDLRY